MTDKLPETPQAALERLLKKVRWSRKALAEGTAYSERMVHRWLEAKNPLPIPPHVLEMLEVYAAIVSAGDSWFKDAGAKPASEFAAFLRVALETHFSRRPAKPAPPEAAGGATNLRLLRSPSPPPIPQTTDPFMLGEIEKENRRWAAEKARLAGLPAPPTIREASREAQPPPPLPLKPKES